MPSNITLPSPPQIVYPETDGLPAAENTLQFRWIVVLFGNLAARFGHRDDVFVAADLFWYPVEGRPEIRLAPDVLLVFGRPKGHRGSYRQWEEGDVPLTVVFEVLSPGNTVPEMDDKCLFYEEHGVEEYYVLDPDHNRVLRFVRQGDVLRRIRPMQGFVSPRLGIRFELCEGELVVHGPDGKRFRTFEEVVADQEKQRADQAEQRVARLAELGRKARQGQISTHELQELERLEQQATDRSS